MLLVVQWKGSNSLMTVKVAEGWLSLVFEAMALQGQLR